MKINIETFKNYKVVDKKKLGEYIDLCSSKKDNKKIKFKTELHHILPKALFPIFSDLKENIWNGVYLTYKDHYIAHTLLAEALDNLSMTAAWWEMNNLYQKSEKLSEPKEIIGSERYNILREQAIREIIFQFPKKDFDKNSSKDALPIQ